jgi:hypothetical protein
MVATTVGSFHKLHDGRAVGVQTPVYVPPPAPVATASAKPTPTTSAKPAAKPAPTATSRHGSPKHTKAPATNQSGTKKTEKPQKSPTHHG